MPLLKGQSLLAPEAEFMTGGLWALALRGLLSSTGWWGSPQSGLQAGVANVVWLSNLPSDWTFLSLLKKYKNILLKRKLLWTVWKLKQGAGGSIMLYHSLCFNLFLCFIFSHGICVGNERVKVEKHQPNFFFTVFFLFHLKNIGKRFIKWKESSVNTFLKSSETWN